MTKCYHCGEEIYGETFTCNQCGYNYCSLHSDAIIHDCEIVRTAVNPYQQPVTPQYQAPSPTYVPVAHTTPTLQERVDHSQSIRVDEEQSSLSRGLAGSEVRGTTDGSFTWHKQEMYVPENAFDPDSGIEFKGILLPHKSEFLHLLIGAILIYVIGLISFYNPQLIEMGYGWTIFLLAAFYMTAFLFHEFGHRQSAKLFGLQTKFRLLSFGMILTSFSLISGIISIATNSISLPAIALPGAVVVLGLDKVDRRTGLCKAAGPMVNLVYGTILLIVSFMIPRDLYPLNMFIGLAAFLNFNLGLFNMLPIGILDGQNIFKWNKGVYILLAGSLIILFLITFANVYAPPEVSLYIPLEWQEALNQGS